MTATTKDTIDRRAFLTRVSSALTIAAVASTVARVARAESVASPSQGGGTQSSASNVEMTADAYKPVRRPRKREAKPAMDDKQVQAFERQLACPCPCTLDVYTCRTTDFTCGISPAVHRDIQLLVDGGYSADEIMNAMLDTYGDFILMEPRKRGFNLLAWIAPFAALAGGAVGIGALLRGWRRNATTADADAAARNAAATTGTAGIDATPEELAQLDAALRNDRR